MNNKKELKKIDYKYLLRCMYFRLYCNGFEEISLKNSDLKNYVPRIEDIFNDYNIDSDDLFAKTPVSETYDKYKKSLIDIFINNELGFFNLNYDGIIIKANPYYVNKLLEESLHYKEILDKCCVEYINKDLHNGVVLKRKKIIIKEK